MEAAPVFYKEYAMIQKLREERGDFSINGVFILMLVFALLALAISLFAIFNRSMKLHTMSAELVRYIEVRGQVDSGVYAELARLKGVTGMDVDCEITADYMSGGARVQFGGLITVRLQYQTSFGLGGALSFPITLKATVTGRSEQYWK